MLKLGEIVPVLSVVFAIGACSTTSSNIPPIPLDTPPQAGNVANLPSYRVQVGDVLGVRMQTNPELNEDVTVRPDGMISTTVAQDVPAANATPLEISQKLQDSYRVTLRDPRISVVVKSFAPNRIYVAGEVNSPGEFVTVGPNLTLSQAMARAGGPRLSASRANIFVLRRGPNDRAQAYKVRYLDVISGDHPDQDVRLAQYDVVYVPRTGIFEVYTFWNQFVQQFVPVSWGFSYNANPQVSVSH
jgi:polysaccharide export outer membrane protein